MATRRAVLKDASGNLSESLTVIDLAETTTPSPTANSALIYSKDDAGVSKMYTLWSDGTEVELGSGSGAGGDYAFDGNATTVDNTLTTISTFTTLTNNANYTVTATFQFVDTTAQITWTQVLRGEFFRNSGGTVTLIDTEVSGRVAPAAGWAVNFAVSGSDIQMQAVGDATNSTRIRASGGVLEFF